MYQNELYDKYPWNLLKTDLPAAVHVTVSEPRRQELSSLLSISPDLIKVIPNGVDVLKFWKMEHNTTTLIDKLDLWRANPLVLLPVRITVRKNIELAIRAIAVCLNHFPDLKMVVTGPLGPHNPANADYFKKLTSLRSQLGLDDRVIFLVEHSQGYIPDEVISDFYRMADALILPSREEGFGIPILEAGISSIPVFCSDIPTLRSLGGDRVSYFSPDSPPEFISSVIIHRLESDQTFRLKTHIKKNYTWRQIYREHIKSLLP